MQMDTQRTVLLVDDDEQVRESLQQLIERGRFPELIDSPEAARTPQAG
jgi:FixJ family two-component response regulator